MTNSFSWIERWLQEEPDSIMANLIEQEHTSVPEKEVHVNILTMPDGTLPWSLEDWFMGAFWCPYVGYSDLLQQSYAYELYLGEYPQGEHTFFFRYGSTKG